ncbi:MAG: UDP-N-acetylmuramate--L-alanine ligase [Peptococcaceae bacterium]|nr:UDP-N-acetylmuramate--L-alanine ligase [Peptococcaceae bacterium]
MNQEQKFNHVHFIGIGGIGMSAVAEVMLERGYTISGSDLNESDQVQMLRSRGATIYVPQRAENITDDIDLVVRSTAIRESNVEYQAAVAKGIPVIHRSEMLGHLMEAQKAICVAGSHGKTTTSSMIALCLEKNGLDPTIVVGGVISDIGSNAKNGKGEWFVAEADESDGSFINLLPWYAVITNIEEDHLDHYKDIAEIRESFKQFLNKTNPEGRCLLCADNDESFGIASQSPVPMKTYGFHERSQYRIKNHKQVGIKNEADIYNGDRFIGHLELQVPGKHNIANATAAVVTCMDVGLTFDEVAAVLKEYKGARRRFQHQGTVDGISVYDDYAHHPTEIAATLEAARAMHEGGRIVAIFQPHRYSRTQFLATNFAEALSQADEVVLLDVFPAGEAPIEGVSSQLIVDQIDPEKHAQVVNDEYLTSGFISTLQPGDLVLVLGAGSIWKQAPLIVKALEERRA